jgi:hypothetical protein
MNQNLANLLPLLRQRRFALFMAYPSGHPYAKELLTPKWCERCLGCNLGTTVPEVS